LYKKIEMLLHVVYNLQTTIYQRLELKQLAKMTTQTECPICMEIIDFKKNCVTTECGHCFHANCLMTSVAHNGFGCPYCRTAMAEEIKDEEDAEDDDDWYDDDESVEEEMFSDHSLRGFRFFMNNIHGESHESEDLEEEQTDSNDIRERIQDTPKPMASFISEKLTEDGVTMEQLIKVLLLEHEEYEEDDEEFARIEGEIFGKMRIIISNYKPEENSEQPKINNTIGIREQQILAISSFVTQRFNRVL
jgi:hypothetical protein